MGVESAVHTGLSCIAIETRFHAHEQGGRTLNKLTALCAAALLAMLVSPVHAETVDCNSEEKDLQKALDDAPAGSELFVTGSCDTGPFFIRKDRVRLIGFGDGGATLSGLAGGNWLLGVDGDNVELRNINILADGFSFGIITAGSKITLDNVDARNAASAGVRVGLSSFANIRGGHFSGNFIGIGVFTYSSTLIQGSTIELNSTGIFVANNATASIGGSMIRNNGTGIFVDEFSIVGVSDSTIEMNDDAGARVGNRNGILQFYDPPNTIENNNPDVRCDSRAIVRSAQTQTSSTNTTDIVGTCLVFGAIF